MNTMNFADFEHYDAQLRRAGNGRDSNTAKIRELTARIGEVEATVEEQTERITSLETAVKDIVRTLVGRGWAERSLSYAAQTLDLNLTELGLKAPADQL